MGGNFQSAGVGAQRSSGLRGHIWGLTLANNASDATNDIDIAAGEAADETVGAVLRLDAALTKRLDAAWAVGSGNGGLDTGSIANGTYHVFLIKNSTSGVVDALFSASATAPTMPSGYDRKRRLGSIIRASSAILLFRQDGDQFMLATRVAAWTGTTRAFAALTLTAVPTGLRVRPLFWLHMPQTAAYVEGMAVADGNYGSAATYIVSHGQYTSTGADMNNASLDWIHTNTSAQVGLYAAGAGTKTLFVHGWIDLRGRLAA